MGQASGHMHPLQRHGACQAVNNPGSCVATSGAAARGDLLEATPRQRPPQTGAPLAWIAGTSVPQLGTRRRTHAHCPLTSELPMVRQQQRLLSGEAMEGSTDSGIKLSG